MGWRLWVLIYLIIVVIVLVFLSQAPNIEKPKAKKMVAREIVVTLDDFVFVEARYMLLYGRQWVEVTKEEYERW